MPDASFAAGESPADPSLEYELIARWRRVEPRQRARSAAVERLLGDSWARHERHLPGASLWAVGGFGRRELAPHSDIDVLLLLPQEPSAGAEAFAAALSAGLWSAGYKLALAVRSLEQTIEDATVDLNFMTSLLDRRRLYGAPALGPRLGRALSGRRLWRPADFFAAKMNERAERHRRYADTAYNLEPNLKEGPGGQRDLQTLRWLLQRCLGRADPAALPDFAAPGEVSVFTHCWGVLMVLREELHQLVGRAEERLLFDHQIALTERLGVLPAALPNQRVESLMQVYFRVARSVLGLSDLWALRLSRQVLRGPAPVAVLSIEGGLVLDDGLIEWEETDREPGPDDIAGAYARLARDPNVLGFGPKLWRAVKAAVARRSARLAEAGRRVLLEAMSAAARVDVLLDAMARHELLGLLVPAYAWVTGRMQYDLFHVYTVDQHTLKVIERLVRLRAGEEAERFPHAAEVWQRIDRPELLFLAALFHDIGKGRGGDHAELGAEDAERFCLAQGFDAASSEWVAWLVRHHLDMSLVAQKQDIQDPEVVRRFAARVADRARLDYLYLLTLADIAATNPKLWNGWKARLLADLYVAARFELRRGLEQPAHLAERIQSKREQALSMLLGEGAHREAVLGLWQAFPEAAFLRWTAEQLRWMTQAILGHEDRERPLVAVRPVPGGSSFEVFVHMPDIDGIFATITAGLDRLDLSVVGARVLADARGYTLDVFQVVDPHPEREPNARQRALEIRIALELALSARPLLTKITRRVSTRQQRHFQVPTEVRVEDSPEGPWTQIALVCADRPGLLARLAALLRERGLKVHSARIATFGERVEDFFQVSDGAALHDPEERQALAAAIHARVEQFMHGGH